MTNSQTVPPVLECPPRIRIVDYKDGDDIDFGWGDFAVDFANEYICRPGEKVYDWQEDIIRQWLATYPTDPITGWHNTYVHTTAAVDAPRQNGKSKMPATDRGLVGAIFKGEQIRYSAQRVDTMLEVFDFCVEIVGDPDDPRQKGRNRDLFEFCRPKVSFVNGHQSIIFKSGGKISFVSRSRDAGRGNTADVNIFDEAQTLTDQQLADSLPNNAAARSGNPQTIFLGTPPQLERDSGEAFARIRDAALNGAAGHCWHEWSVEEIGDVKDRSRWYATNPSLGKSLIEKKLADDLLKMTPLVFAIEHLCYWPQEAKPQILDAEKWKATGTEDPPTDEEIWKRAVGIKFSPTGQVCASIAVMKKDGTVHGELIADEFIPQTSGAGMKAMIDWLVERREQLALIAMDGKSGAGELYERLLNARTPEGKKAFKKPALAIMKTGDVPVAASMVLNGIAENTLTHYPEETLDASAIAAERRRIGNDGVGFGGDSCPIESFAAAVWAVRTTKRDPSRKARWIQ